MVFSPSGEMFWPSEICHDLNNRLDLEEITFIFSKFIKVPFLLGLSTNNWDVFEEHSSLSEQIKRSSTCCTITESQKNLDYLSLKWEPRKKILVAFSELLENGYLGILSFPAEGERYWFFCSRGIPR